MRLTQPSAARACAIVLLLASAPLLAGCLEASGAALDEARAKVGLPPDEVPARSLLDEAEDEARAWDETASLVGVFAIERTEMPGEAEADDENEAEEPANESDSESDSEEQVPVDPDVANGKAPAWWFAFQSANGVLGFRVNADGTISEREEQGNPESDEEGNGASGGMFEGLHALGEWPVNSHEAWDLVGENATWQDAMTNVTPIVASSMLFAESEGEAAEDDNATAEETVYVARWMIYAVNESGHGAGAVVNAVNGTIEAVFPWEPFDFDFDFDWDWDTPMGPVGWGDGAVVCCAGPASFEESYGGRVTLLEPTMRFDVPVSAQGEAVFLNLEQQSPSVFSPGIELRLLGPDDEEVELEQQEFQNMGFNVPTGYFVGYPPGPGDYVLEVSIAEPNLFVDYSVDVQVGVPVEVTDEEGSAPVGAGLLRALPLRVA